MPNCIHFTTLVVDLYGFELQSLSIGIDSVHDTAAAWGQGSDIQMMCCGDRVTNKIVTIEYWHDKPDIRSMAGATIGIVVHDDVSGSDRVVPIF